MALFVIIHKTVGAMNWHRHEQSFDPHELGSYKDGSENLVWYLMGRVWDCRPQMWVSRNDYGLSDIKIDDGKITATLFSRTFGNSRFDMEITGEGLNIRGPW